MESPFSNDRGPVVAERGFHPLHNVLPSKNGVWRVVTQQVLISTPAQICSAVPSSKYRTYEKTTNRCCFSARTGSNRSRFCWGSSIRGRIQHGGSRPSCEGKVLCGLSRVERGRLVRRTWSYVRRMWSVFSYVERGRTSNVGCVAGLLVRRTWSYVRHGTIRRLGSCVERGFSRK